VHKEESVSAKIQDENMIVIEKHFHGVATQDILSKHRASKH